MDPRNTTVSVPAVSPVSPVRQSVRQAVSQSASPSARQSVSTLISPSDADSTRANEYLLLPRSLSLSLLCAWRIIHGAHPKAPLLPSHSHPEVCCCATASDRFSDSFSDSISCLFDAGTLLGSLSSLLIAVCKGTSGVATTMTGISGAGGTDAIRLCD